MLGRQCFKVLWTAQEELIHRGVTLSTCLQHINRPTVADHRQQQARNYGTPVFGIIGERTCQHKLLSVRPGVSCVVPTRGKIKKVQKQKGKANAPKVADVDTEDIIDIEEYESKLEKHLTKLREEFISNLAVTANLESFENLQVQTSAGTFPLNNLATVIQKSPSLIIIDLQRSPQYMSDVTNALKKSQTSLNPQQSSPTSLAIQMPKVSRERREQLAKSAKTLLTARKAKINKTFDEFAKQAQKNTSSRDLLKTVTDALLKMKKITETKADDMMKAKQQELLKDK